MCNFTFMTMSPAIGQIYIIQYLRYPEKGWGSSSSFLHAVASVAIKLASRTSRNKHRSLTGNRVKLRIATWKYNTGMLIKIDCYHYFFKNDKIVPLCVLFIGHQYVNHSKNYMHWTFPTNNPWMELQNNNSWSSDHEETKFSSQCSTNPICGQTLWPEKCFKQQWLRKNLLLSRNKRWWL